MLLLRVSTTGGTRNHHPVRHRMCDVWWRPDNTVLGFGEVKLKSKNALVKLAETYVSGESQFLWYVLSGLKQQRKA